MRVEIGQASSCERLTEYIADWPGTLPAFATAKANRRKAAIFAKADLRGRKQRVIIAPKQGVAQVVTPVPHNRQGFTANREKPSRKGLAGLCLHVAGVLIDAALQQTAVLQQIGRASGRERWGQNG